MSRTAIDLLFSMHTSSRWRLALLALLLALPNCTATCTATAGYITLDLLSTNSTACDTNLHALCLASFQASIDADCKVALTPLNGSGVYVPGIWSTNAAGTYKRPVQCPTSASAPVDPGSLTPSALKSAFQTALERHVYGAAFVLGISQVTWTNGTVTVATVAGSCTLKYAITKLSAVDNSITAMIGSDAEPAVCAIDGTVSNGAECQLALIDDCPPGTRPVELPSGGKACARCRAGTYSVDGKACTACAAGKFVGSVGASVCTSPCAAGSYASGGYSECLPCNPGTYQSSTGKATCNACPYRSYARLPGATLCVRCMAGIAVCVAGTFNGTECSDDFEAPTPGYHVLSIETPSTLKTLACNLPADLSFGNPPLFGQCTLSSSPTTYLSVYVDQYCGVQIWPIRDTPCSEPSAAYWSSMKLKAHYIAPDRIATSLATPTSSYLLTLAKASSTTLTLSYWPATTNTSVAGTVAVSQEKMCSGTIEVVGNQVGGVPATPAPCPAGSYDAADAVDGCRPCPVGATCNGTSATLCSIDSFQPFLGQAQNACQMCNASTDPRYTSEVGADYCTVPYIDSVCTDGHEYNAETTTCDECPAGTERKVGREDFCVPCLPGYYSSASATNCTICPRNQFSPVYGLAQRSTGAQKCLYCPTGSAATVGELVGQEGSTSCSPCDPGTYATIEEGQSYHTCVPCPDGYYRSGDASIGNNACRPIPAGYKEVNRTTTTYDRAQIQVCSKGEVSYWLGSTRHPSNPQTCQPCLGDNKYAPRTGMSSCQPCKAGTAPTQSSSALPGNDKCDPCVDNTYRPFSSTSSACLICNAGREVTSGNTACTPCITGHYMPDNNNGTNTTLPALSGTCLPCEINSFQNQTGQTRCILCPAGTSTSETGNAACQPCAHGYYSPNAATSCVASPGGAFVNTTGAKTYSLCPIGTFSNEEGVDECNICVPGQYANTAGSKGCKTCPAGTYSMGGAASCRPCLAGYYSSSGSGSCSPCKPGSFTSSTRTATCTRCPLGNQCPTLATRAPQPCPRGQYSNKEGNRLCTPCPVNTYQDAAGQRGCKSCASGFSTRGLTGQSACQAVRQGRPSRRLLLA